MMDRSVLDKSFNQLKAQSLDYSRLKLKAKSAIASMVEAINANPLVSDLNSGETWLRFTYCGRKFLVRCLYNIISMNGSIQWNELVKNPEDTKYEIKLLLNSNIDKLGNVDGRYSEKDYGQMFYYFFYDALRQARKDGEFPLEAFSLYPEGK